MAKTLLLLYSTDDHYLGYIRDIFVEWRIYRSKMMNIKERLLRLESQKFKAMTAMSHLEQSIYVYPVSYFVLSRAYKEKRACNSLSSPFNHHTLLHIRGRICYK